MTSNILIIGGGTAGWICAGYLAQALATDRPGATQITLIESEDIGILGVGEGAIPSLRKTLARIGLDEARLIREGGATFKQGVRFRGWRNNPGTASDYSYYHPFQIADQHSDIDLLPYWLMQNQDRGEWAPAATVQPRLMDASRGPKLITQPPYSAPVNYAYHFDAAQLARLLRSHVCAMGVHHKIDTIKTVEIDETGRIASVSSERSGEMHADLYIDCSGFAARLIGQALGCKFTSLRHQLFCDRAVAFQVPYETSDAPLASCTISTAQPHGWNWDIGLMERRGVGYVYSSQHTNDEAAETLLRSLGGSAGDNLDVRHLRFEAGYRKTQWHKNCVAVGLSAGFIEPLEATGIWFAEMASLILVGLLPSGTDYEAAAGRFNTLMTQRFLHVADFIKLHYVLSARTDTDFWCDNRKPNTVSDSLLSKLDAWRYRAPSFVDAETSSDVFPEQSWQYILYGMGFKTDLGRGGRYRFYERAQAEFASVRRQADYALTVMPDHRALVEDIRRNGFGPGRAA